MQRPSAGPVFRMSLDEERLRPSADSGGEPDENGSEREHACDVRKGQRALTPGRRRFHTTCPAGPRPRAPVFDRPVDIASCGEGG